LVVEFDKFLLDIEDDDDEDEDETTH